MKVEHMTRKQRTHEGLTFGMVPIYALDLSEGSNGLQHVHNLGCKGIQWDSETRTRSMVGLDGSLKSF